jgi:hypothetical protein
MRMDHAIDMPFAGRSDRLADEHRKFRKERLAVATIDFREKPDLSNTPKFISKIDKCLI